MVGRAFVLLVRCVRMGFQEFAVAGDPGDLPEAGIGDQPIGWREDIDGALFQAAMIFVPVLGKMAGGLCVPVDRGEDLKGFRGVALHGEHIIRGLGDQGRGLTRGVQRIHRDHLTGNVTALQKILSGCDLTALVMEVKRRAGSVIGEGHGLIVPLSVAIGGTDALAVGGQCFCEKKARPCPRATQRLSI